jgi:hypothetical protein
VLWPVLSPVRWPSPACFVGSGPGRVGPARRKAGEVNAAADAWAAYWRYWRRCVRRWVPLAGLAVAMAVWTRSANRHGVNPDADVVFLEPTARVHKAAVRMFFRAPLRLFSS